MAAILGMIASAPGQARSPADVLQHHLAAVNSGDVDAIVSDYAPGAVIMMPGKVNRGQAAIRAAFAPLAAMQSPKMVVTPISSSVDQNVAMVKYTTNIGYSGQESYVIVDGKIAYQAVFFDKAE